MAKVTEQQVNGAVVVSLSGEVDMHCSPEVRKHLQSLVKQKVRLIVVDLSDVSYIDSSGLATLVECLKGTKQYDGVLRLSGVNERIGDVFKLARLDRIFDIRENPAVKNNLLPAGPAPSR